ncbi:hypothetical protein EOM82_00350 [bacterium]|nr:hypothetical protein [bacterium]
MKIDYDKALLFLRNLKSEIGCAKNVAKALSFIDRFTTAIKNLDEVEARRLLDETEKEYFTQMENWEIRMKSYFAKSTNEPSIWERAIHRKNMIPIYCLLKIGKDALVEQCLVTGFSGF